MKKYIERAKNGKITKKNKENKNYNTIWGARETWTKFLRAYLGISPTWASVEEYFEICGTEEFKNMPIFPEQGSVQEINGVMVVKLTNDVPTE